MSLRLALLVVLIFGILVSTLLTIDYRLGGLQPFWFHLSIFALFVMGVLVRCGEQALRELVDCFGQRPDLVLAAYNAGQDNVDRWRRARKGIQFAETRAYVKRVEELKRIYRQAYGSELGA